MNWLFYRRIRGPIFLLTFGVTAALAQWHILSFGRSWPLYLIVYGVLRLVEGAAFAASPTAGVYPPYGYSPQSYGVPVPGLQSYPPPAPGYVSPRPGAELATLPTASTEPTRHTSPSGNTQEES